MKIRIMLLLVVVSYSLQSIGQEIKYYDANNFTLVGSAFDLNEGGFMRVDSLDYPNLLPVIKSLYAHSAGLAVTFKTNSSKIALKWQTSDRNLSTNMSAIVQKGLDLYIKRDGKWIYAGVAKPKITEPPYQNHSYTVINHMDSSMKECLLYLPLYDELHNLEIGIDENTRIESLDAPFRNKIIVYGSSIVHGASASRSGMAYPATLSRRTGLNFVNMGISGRARLEIEVAEMLVDTKADAFILDCFPNPSPEQIRSRTIPFINYIRERCPQTPIIVIQTIVRESTNFNLKISKYEQDKRTEARIALTKLMDAGDPNLYFIDEKDFIGDDHDGTADGVHPSDLGFDRMLEIIEPRVISILNRYGVR